MCITLHASKMSGTKVYAGEANKDGVYVHVLAYQNVAASMHSGPNAMILPIPAKGSLGPLNLIDTRKFKHFLSDIAEATKEPSLSRSRSFSKGAPASLDSLAEVFDVGSYTVVLAERPGQVAEALERVPANKRPTINNQVLASYNKNYPGWPLAVCCWSGETQAEPILLWYEPKVPTYLFAPALDAHDGEAPKQVDVTVDHIVAFGSTLRATGNTLIQYSDLLLPQDVAALLPFRAVGERIRRKSLPNGDFWYPVTNLDGNTDYTEPAPALRFFPGAGNPKTEIPLGRWSLCEAPWDRSKTL